MVSRSLEKMMLIAVGLSTAVIIGVPVLLYAIDTMATTQHLQEGELAAQQIFNATRQVDVGEYDSRSIQVYLPAGISITTDSDYTLIITLNLGVDPPASNAIWSETFLHPIVISPPTESGNYNMTFTLESNVIYITYSLI
ncbi:MAG: hypothetical protein JW779_08420 [Candidatus Thorarchaeota archaeon]|nr:hypothetical protein [Candidatus Thorarchaeota archaeon]